MEPSLIAVVVGSLSSIAGAVAWLVRRHDTKKDPIPKQAAELALAQQALGIITDAAAWSKQDAASLRINAAEDRKRIAQLEADREEDRVRAALADERMSRLEQLLSHAAAYIEALLRWAKVIPVYPGNPIPPLPVALHELVNPQLWVTEADPPKES